MQRKIKWVGARQRSVLRLFVERKYVSRRQMQDACPWARVEFFLDRTLQRLVQKGLVRFEKFKGYRLVVNRNSVEWRKLQGGDHGPKEADR